MASQYMVAAGWNIALASLTKLSPQPASSGVKATDIQYLADGSIYRQGLYIELMYNSIFNSIIQFTPVIIYRYQAILTAYGLWTANSAQVTVYVPDDTLTYTRYNGVAVRPEANRSNYFLRDTPILIRNLIPI
jgi:hypothetical protein